jgi:hypothetical protein
LTPVLESTGWIVTNGSIGGNNTTLLNNRYDTDAVPVNPDVILIGFRSATKVCWVIPTSPSSPSAPA